MKPDFSQPGLRVRATYDSAKWGITTGMLHRSQGRTLVEVRHVSGDLSYIPDDNLELAPENETRADAIKGWRFSGRDALLKEILNEKIGGSLTDVFYSMGSGAAEFFPHQFKPVLKFVSSTTGRLLIADEVGLGKTIEAIYIWRELQARIGARRLLVLCPGALRTKWQDELSSRFALEAEIVNAERLCNLLESTANDANKSFIAIAGIEGIRSKKVKGDIKPKKPREKLAALLNENEATSEAALFDLVIVDEAHNLRNPETANHQTALSISNAANHLILLTATPIQLGGENLYQLLSFIDPERFPSLDAFYMMQEANRPVTRALNALLDSPPRRSDFRESLTEMSESHFFADDPVVLELLDDEGITRSAERRVQAARLLETRSLFSDVWTRTRKRDCMENRVKRVSRVVRVVLNEQERQLYDSVTTGLQDKAYRCRSTGGSTIFELIGRQRMMASCIPAAVERWRERGLLDELLWEDLGVSFDEALEETDPSVDIATGVDFSLNDSKYAQLSEILAEVGRNKEKLIIFSFFIPTLAYLERRLRADGFSCAKIIGGMGDAKEAELDRFRDPLGAQILLSSEVGSEGIDLQFARILVNYDLPWNPMKVEQRIGRIDRLGQKADKILIFSFVLADTIEEIILERLYERIAIFETSIGDLEEIVGESVDKILLEYFRRQLTTEEVKTRLEQNALAAEAKRQAEDELIDEAPDLAGHMDYVLSSIQRSHESGHWIRPNDLVSYLTEFLQEFYPGSKIEEDLSIPGLYKVDLSPVARNSLQQFLERTRPPRTTRMTVPGEVISVVFDPSLKFKSRLRSERVDVTHPIILWAKEANSREGKSREVASAIQLHPGRTTAEPGIYVWSTDVWNFEGLRKDIRIKNRVMSLMTSDFLDPVECDRLLDDASRYGERLDMDRFAEVQEELISQYLTCERALVSDFLEDRHVFNMENSQKIKQALLLLQNRADKKLRELRQRLDDQRHSQDEKRRRIAGATEGKIKKLEADLEQRKAKIEANREPKITRRAVSGGFILIGK